MSDMHSVIEHRANYYFLKIEEDYVEICQGKHKHCKAAILSILEQWMNAKRTATSQDDDLYVYLSYPQFVKRMFRLYGRSTVIASLDELEKDGLILKRPYTDAFNQETFEYRLNRPVVQKMLHALPEKPSAWGSLNLNYPRSEVNDGSSKSKPGGSSEVNDGSSKSKRNVDTNIDTEVDTTKESESVLSSTESIPPRDTHTSFENSSREREQDEPLHSHRNNSGNEHGNQPVLHTLRPAPDTHGAPSDERSQEQVPLAEPPAQQAHSAGAAMSTTAPRTPNSPPLSGVRGVPPQDHNRVGSPPADDKSQTNKPVLSKQELTLRRKWAKYVTEDVTRETVIIALQLRSAWLEAYGAYGDAEWDNRAILWIAQQDNGTWENIQKVYRLWEDKEPSKPIHPEMIKNKWFWLSEKKSATPDKPATTAASSISHVSQEISDRNLARLHARIAAKRAAAGKEE